ncbi:MAG: tRNA (adenosine(37)-N6)-threonylcarbamoyltransferase complex dimerization subunit type 1 TsaB [Oscillospiraceae bacterium]|nr:tRNA (adenosine(37)-N6)-threonylcarbamoyltransferase complex dimerization subunit type 1 TsaB [Oscillospiraceae bacterium]
MKILAFETSAKAASVALLEKGKLLGENYQNTGLTHSQTLMVMAEDMLKACGLTAQDVDAVAVAAGPGSFTGVRIGVAAAKGFAWGAQLPCYGVSTLEAMARNLGVYQGYVVPAMDARRSQVYTAIFHADKGELTRVEEDMAISLAELGEKIKNFGQPVFLVGDGATLCYNTLLEEVPGLVLPKEHRMHQRAAGVALAAQAMADCGDPGNAAELTPNYLRLSQAERERLARENR